VDATLFDLARADQRFAYEAYEFVCQAVNYTQISLGKYHAEGDDELDEDERPCPHVNGEEILRHACELAIEEFGYMAGLVFRRWGVHTTDDFGEIVFRLIDSGKLSRSDDDDPADFQGIFDLGQALSEGFELDCAAYPARRTER
jgi:uncharacterized repeat protein (TIGR04138 family)